MLCAESLRVQACFDGEVDAVSAVEIERHIERCAECQALYRHLEQTRTALRRDLSYYRVPAPLAARVRRALPASPRWSRRVGPGFWTGALSGVGVMGVAAALALLLWLPLRVSPVIDDLLSAHLRSLMSSRLIDVASSDRHTVKPWFAGHADVSPAVADFESQGYKLIGGRVEYLARQRAAVLVYQHGAHVIDVFVWAADGGPGGGHMPRCCARASGCATAIGCCSGNRAIWRIARWPTPAPRNCGAWRN